MFAETSFEFYMPNLKVIRRAINEQTNGASSLIFVTSVNGRVDTLKFKSCSITRKTDERSVKLTCLPCLAAAVCRTSGNNCSSGHFGKPKAFKFCYIVQHMLKMQ